MADAQKIETAFQRASEQLGFEFRSPYSVEPREGMIVRSIGLVVGFGSQHGTIIFADGSDDKPIKELRAFGFFSSVLSSSYELFDERHFIGTLDDWGYFGPDANRPSWYSGAPWTSRRD